MSKSRKKKKRRKRRTWLTPQEVEVWYVIPSIRRELARIMIEKGQPQKNIARMLGVTEPAVTQYKLKKSERSRGDQIEIPEDFLPDIDKSADRIIKVWEEHRDEMGKVYETMTREINLIIRKLRDDGILCEVHREHCDGVHPDCGACKDGAR